MRSLSDFRPYQHQALRHCIDTPRSYLAAKAGAGKTAVALALIDHVLYDSFEASKVLVVAPKRVAAQWPTEALNWAFGRDLRFGVYLGSMSQRAATVAATHDVLCTSFEFFPELVKSIRAKDWPYGLVVFDEASRLRNGGRRGSVGWKVMQAIAKKTNARILLMSGSPRPGTAHELFAPVAILDQGQRLGTTLTQFRSDYLEPAKQNRHTGQVYSWRLRDGMEHALYGRIADLYFAVAPDLGLKKVVIDRAVRMPAPASMMANQLMRDQVVDLDDLEITAPSQGNVTGKVHQIGQGAVFDDRGVVQELHTAKLDELAELLEGIDAPVIVCYWYSHDKERLLAKFPGAVDITTAAGLEDAKAGRVDLALLHPGSAGHGVDGLQAVYSHMVWFALPASFELYDQANARIVRSGMVGDTATIYRILCGPVDQRIVERLAQKEAEQDTFYEHLEGKA